jgi:hypothetical protein
MYLSGVRIYIAVMLMVNTSEATLYTRKAVPTVFIAVAAGTTRRGTCGHLIATATPRISGTSTWVSALPGRLIEE